MITKFTRVTAKMIAALEGVTLRTGQRRLLALGDTCSGEFVRLVDLAKEFSAPPEELINELQRMRFI